MNPLKKIQEETSALLVKSAKLTVDPKKIIMPEAGHGDLALACFDLAKEQKVAPSVVAHEAAEKTNEYIVSHSSLVIGHCEAVGPYLNFYLKRNAISELVQQLIKNGDYGDAREARSKKIILEYVSPNTNKPLHLGHLRNAVLGWSVANLLKTQGHKVTTAEIINDRGIHIMKSLLAYELWGNNVTPESINKKGDHLVGDYYVKFAKESAKNETLEKEAQGLLKKWEEGDQELRQLWQKLNRWAENGHKITTDRLGISFDLITHESEIFKQGKAVVEDALQKGLVEKQADGAIAVDLSEENLGTKILLRSDGTGMYITQDLALAQKCFKKMKADEIIYVVGQEQDYHFKVLFTLLDRFGLVPKDKLRHLSYHWVFLPEGRMKSREGTAVDADNLLDTLHDLAAAEVKSRDKSLANDAIMKRAEVIALAAAKFYLLRVRPDSDIHFNPEESISFTGRTGPYLLYTYARMQSIFTKAQGQNMATVQDSADNINDYMWALVMKMANFPTVISTAAKKYDPSLMADFAYEFSRAINDFYENTPVLKAENPNDTVIRLELLNACSVILKRALTLLNIKTLDHM